MRGDVVEIAAFRARKRQAAQPRTAPAHLYAEPGTVVLEFGRQAFDAKTERLMLTPAHARVWAERLAAMAAAAEALEQEARR